MGARSWRTLGGLAIWVGVLGGIVLLVFVFMSGLSELGVTDCGSNCTERSKAAAQREELLTYLATFGGGFLVLAGVVIRVVIPNPDKSSERARLA